MRKKPFTIRMSEDCEKQLLQEYESSGWEVRLNEFIRILFVRGLNEFCAEQEGEKKRSAVRFAMAAGTSYQPKPETGVRAAIIPFPKRTV